MRAKYFPKRSTGLPLAATITFLAGCAAPNYTPQPLDTAQLKSDFIARSADAASVRDYLAGANVNTAAWPLPAWGLRELTWLAFFWHPDLIAARAQAGIARAGLAVAGARANPELEGIVEHHARRADGESPWSVGAALRVPLPADGKRAARLARAEALADLAGLDAGEVAWQVRSRVRQRFVDLYAAEREVGILRREQVLRREELAILDRRYAVGAESARAAGSAGVRLGDLELAIVEAAGRSRAARLALGEAVGLPAAPMAALPLSFAALEAPTPAIDDAALQATALGNRLDVRRGLLRYAAAEAALRLEMAGPLSELVLKPGYLWDQGANVWAIGLGLVLPVLNRNAGPIAEAGARREAAAKDFAAVQARAIQELDAARSHYAQANRQIDAAGRLRAGADAQAAAAERSFAAGASDRLDLTRSRLDTVLAERRRLAAQLEGQRALARLEDAVQRPLDDVPAPPPSVAQVARHGQDGR